MNIFEKNKSNPFHNEILSLESVTNTDERGNIRKDKHGNPHGHPFDILGYGCDMMLSDEVRLDVLKRTNFYGEYAAFCATKGDGNLEDNVLTVSKNDARAYVQFYFDGDVSLCVDAYQGEMYDNDVPLSDEEKATLRELYWADARDFVAGFDKLPIAKNGDTTISAENGTISGEVLVRKYGYDHITPENPWYYDNEALCAMYIGAFMQLNSVEEQKELLRNMNRVSLISPTASSVHVAFTVDEKGDVSRSLVFNKGASQFVFELPALPDDREQQFLRNLDNYLGETRTTAEKGQKVLQNCGKLDKSKNKTTVERD